MMTNTVGNGLVFGAEGYMKLDLRGASSEWRLRHRLRGREEGGGMVCAVVGRVGGMVCGVV